jgi:hypothetical protein
VRQLKITVPVLLVFLLALICASGASADGTVTWGISGVTPSLNTANGDVNDVLTPGLTVSSACPNGITCSPQVNPLSGTNPILPGPFAHENTANTPHSAEDLGVWNPGITAPTGGQIVSIQVTGCALEDVGSPVQESQGVPVNTLLFQTLTPSGSSWTVDNTAGAAAGDGSAFPFQLPFCQSAANPTGASAGTVTTYEPLHLCVNAGDVVAFHDLGGFVDDGGPFYPQGIPMEVLAPVSGPGTDSFIGVGVPSLGPGVFGTLDTTLFGQDQSGYATEADQEVTLQVVEATGNDAYGLCSGGFGDEPLNSNAIDCDFTTSADGTGAANPVRYPDHPFCADAGRPIPGSNVPSAPSTSGTPTTPTTSIPKPAPKPTPKPTTVTAIAGQSKATNRPAPSPVPTAPVLRHLRSNPPRFVARRGTTITYIDSRPGVTTLRFYRLTRGRRVLVRTLRHPDRATTALPVSGLAPGRYLLQAGAVYRGVRGHTVSARFTVIAQP